MRISDWVPLCVSLLLLGITPDFTGCKIVDFFGKDSSALGNSLYAPPAIPETLEQEQPAVQARINELSQALEAKDVEKAVDLCGGQEKYREMFQNNKEKMPNLSKLLGNSKLTLINAGYGSNGVRMGEVSVDIASKTFTMNVVKVNGKWYFQDL